MNFNSFQAYLRQNGIAAFTPNDASRITGKAPSYCKVFLSRQAKAGNIQRIEKGKYCPTGADLHEVASSLASPSYISFLSALAYHGLTTQIPHEMQVACIKQKKPVEFGGMRIVFSKLRRSAFFGFGCHGNAIVATAEKAVMDGLLFPEKLPIGEAFFAIRQGKLDVGRLAEYAFRLRSSIVNKRLGCLLERAGIFHSLSLPHNKKIDLLNPLNPKKGRISRRWGLLINEVLE